MIVSHQHRFAFLKSGGEPNPTLRRYMPYFNHMPARLVHAKLDEELFELFGYECPPYLDGSP